jgi:hypothetical protein
VGYFDDKDKEAVVKDGIDHAVVADAKAVGVIAGEFDGAGCAGVILKGFEASEYAGLNSTGELLGEIAGRIRSIRGDRARLKVPVCV